MNVSRFQHVSDKEFAMRIKTLALAACITAVAATSASASSPAQVVKPRIQLAILLDTSSSMDGLINQAREQLWKVVNELATAKRGGARPHLEVSVLEYGNDTLNAKEGFIRVVVPLTDDLDKVSEELFALRTNGGSEHCGQVIDVATKRLKWSKSNKDLKLIYIAGNEPFSQGPVDYRKAVKGAIGQGIQVNTVHCGNSAQGISGGWQDGAMLADGIFLNIDQNEKVAHIPSPQDKRIAELNAKLNNTYIAYGHSGAAGVARQAKQDDNAGSMSESAKVQRAVSKSTAYYRNSAWDLVDAMKDGKVSLDKVPEDQLPENMRKMSKAERTAYVAKMAKDRADIQAEIRKLGDARKKFVSAKRKEMASKSGKETLDSAMIKSIRTQAKKKAFAFQK